MRFSDFFATLFSIFDNMGAYGIKNNKMYLLLQIDLNVKLLRNFFVMALTKVLFGLWNFCEFKL